MRRQRALWFISIVIAVVVVAAASAQKARSQSSACNGGTLAYYPMTEATGTTIHDICNGYDGSWTQGVSWASDSEGPYLQFSSGSNPRITINTSALSNDTSTTVEVRMMPGTDRSGALRVISQMGSGQLRFTLDYSGSRLTVWGASGSADFWFCGTGNTSCLPAGQWTHVAFQIQDTQVWLYYNGTLVSSGTLPNPQTLRATSANTEIGDGEGINDFDGGIQYVRISQGIRNDFLLTRSISTPTPTATNTPTNTPTNTLTPTNTPTNTPIPSLKDTIGIYRTSSIPNQNSFFLRLANSTGPADIYIAYGGSPGTYPVVGDWTGSGVTTIGVVTQSNGTFQLRNSNSAGNPDEFFVLGNPNDMPIAGHWDNTTLHDGVGVFRPSNGLIYLKKQLTTGFADYTMVLGIPGDQGLAGDWDGNGFDSPGVYRPSNSGFYLTNKVCNCSVYADYTVYYGIGGDSPVVGDWTGQGHDGIGLFRQSNGYTYLKNQLTTGYADITFVYGIAGDIPVAGHWEAGSYAPPPVPSNLGNVLMPPSAVPVPSPGLGD